MEINVSNHITSKADNSETAETTAKSSIATAKLSDNGISDKLSISSYAENKGEELFAKIEMEKINQSSFDKLKLMKSKISEYQAAKEISAEAAGETEIGNLLNNPDVWGVIADKISK